MGFYTTFKLQQVYPPQYQQDVAVALNSLARDCNIESGFNAKWHDFDVDAADVSAKFKNVAFVVQGIREDYKIWYKEFYNGCQSNYWEQKPVMVTDRTRYEIDGLF